MKILQCYLIIKGQVMFRSTGSFFPQCFNVQLQKDNLINSSGEVVAITEREQSVVGFCRTVD